MNGIICVNKEKDFTSFDVVAIMKRLAKTRKIGHGGTLDPMAEGVLPLFIGSATKSVDLCPVTDKAYRAGFRLGAVSNTQDIWGKVEETSNRQVSEAELLNAVSAQVGEIEQLPPMFSAIKINGQRLYDLARQGIEVERKARHITVYEIKLISYAENEGVMEISCSAGTYIRTIINDIGIALGTGAIMTSLTRTKSGVFTLDNCHTLDELKALSEKDFGALEKLALPVETLYKGCYPELVLDEVQERMFFNGVKLDILRMGLSAQSTGVFFLKNNVGQFIGLGEIDGECGLSIKLRHIPQ